jgi:hypothetical protein
MTAQEHEDDWPVGGLAAPVRRWRSLSGRNRFAVFGGYVFGAAVSGTLAGIFYDFGDGFDIGAAVFFFASMLVIFMYVPELARWFKRMNG